MKNSSRTLVLGLAFSFLAACSNESSKVNKLVPKSDTTKEEVSEKPKDFTAFNPKVDILFVIDNSGSMLDAQKLLKENAFKFADSISKAPILNFHIGVLTTDMGNQMQSGRLVGRPIFLEKTTPDFIKILSNRMVVGTNGSGSEQMFAPIKAALSTPLISADNAGFYRQDAYLAVIFLTDAADQSKLSPQDLLLFLNKLKVEPSKVLGYGVIRTLAEEKSCDSEEFLDDKIENFLAMVSNGSRSQNNILSLCSPDYGTKLAEFAQDIVNRTSGQVKLSRLPNVKTIKVMYGTQEIPNDPVKGWVYSPATNSIVLAEGIDWIDQGQNVGLSIDFEVIEVQP